MNDWKSQLAELYKGYSTQQKNTKGEPHKGDSLENFRGKKGFNDTGIALSPKAAKKQQHNRSSYRYPRHLQRINERRKKMQKIDGELNLFLQHAVLAVNNGAIDQAAGFHLLELMMMHLRLLKKENIHTMVNH